MLFPWAESTDFSADYHLVWLWQQAVGMLGEYGPGWVVLDEWTHPSQVLS